MRPLALSLFLPLLLLCCAASAHADPIIITGGSVFMGESDTNFSVNLTAPSFSFRGFTFGIPQGPLCGSCHAGAIFPSTIRIFAPEGPSLTYNGVDYSLNQGIIQGSFVITMPPLTIPTDYSPIVTPFSFSGAITFNSAGRSTFSPFTVGVIGSGTVRFTFTPLPGGVQSFIGPASFNFAPAAVPEPATLLLLGTGLIGAAAASKRHGRIIDKEHH